MSKGIKHHGKEKFKLQVELVFNKVSHLAKEHNGNTTFIKWRRGTKKVSGTTQCALVSKGEAIWNEKIEFTGTFFSDRHGKFDEKKFTISLKEDTKKKKGHSIGKLKFNIAEHANRENQVVQIPLKKGSKSDKTEFKLTISSRPLKFEKNPLSLLSPDDEKKPENKDKLIKEINGKEYILEKSDEKSDDTSQETISEMSAEDSEDNEDPPDPDDKPSDPEKEKLLEQIEMLESESYERLTIIEKMEKEIKDLKEKNGAGAVPISGGGGTSPEMGDLKKQISKLKKVNHFFSTIEI